MMGPRFGVAIAMSAVAVNGPLLVLSLLRADGIPLSIEWHVALVTLRALGTVAVMTVGSAFIAHAAAVDLDLPRFGGQFKTWDLHPLLR